MSLVHWRLVRILYKIKNKELQMPLWPTTKYITSENENTILLTNSHGQVKPRLTEKRETLRGEFWLHYLMEEKRGERGGGGEVCP